MSIDQFTLKRARKGDQAAFETILAQHENMIFSVCQRMCGNREDAMDLTQETAIRLWRNIGMYTEKAALSTWIYRIAVNACLDFLRRRKDVFSIEELGQEGYAPAAPEREGPQQALEDKERLEELGRMLTQLPPEQRTAVILRDVQDLSYEEVAQVLGVNLNTVKSRISRGRKSLRAIIIAGQLFGEKTV